MSYPLPLRNPPRLGQRQHFRAEVAYVFTAAIAICIGFLPPPHWGCEKFSTDCFRPKSPIISPWKPLAQAEEQQPQSAAAFPPLTLAGVPLCSPSILPTLQVLQPPGAQASEQLQPRHLPGMRTMQLGTCRQEPWQLPQLPDPRERRS